jgi:hypothetical protein
MLNKLYIVIGAYGSGKSEYSVHLARQLNTQNYKVVLADLDVVNPYFRTRDVKDAFEKEGIEVIAPEGQYRHADVPMISPKIKGSIENQNLTVILDVGGDPAGCRVLARFTDACIKRGYQMIHVINTNRPFTSTPDEITLVKEMLEFASKLTINEFICNTNLMEFTDTEVVKKGIKIIQEAAEKNDKTFDKYLVLDRYSDRVESEILGKVKEIMTYTMRKPWEITSSIGI